MSSQTPAGLYPGPGERGRSCPRPARLNAGQAAQSMKHPVVPL